MLPRRYLYIPFGLVIILLLPVSHPTSRAHLNFLKDYGLEKVTHLIDEAKTHLTSASSSSKSPSASETAPTDSSKLFTGEKWFFEYDNELYPQPQYDVYTLSTYAPHNYRGPGQPTLATFFATRNGSLQDPYFLSAQQQLYRVLWDSHSKSRYPMTIFVAPFVHQEQRRILAAAGANVQELPLVDWAPAHDITAPLRWRDQFSKLNLWARTDFSRMLYLDTDAFPLENVDVLIDEMALEQKCKPELLEPEDQVDVEQMCSFTFTAAKDQREYLNAGMFVIRPDKAMHEHLLRGMVRDREKYDNNMVEQGYLQHVFREDGPFPGQYIDRSWNAIETTAEDEGKVHILHDKLWIFYFRPDHWATSFFNDTWYDMLELYKSQEFADLRAADGAPA